MASARITCINKSGGYHDNPHEAISHYGWVDINGATGKSNRADMVNWIESGNSAYVTDSYGNKVYCMIKTSRNGNKFLQTESDGKPTNNLLELPECQ